EVPARDRQDFRVRGLRLVQFLNYLILSGRVEGLANVPAAFPQPEPRLPTTVCQQSVASVASTAASTAAFGHHFLLGDFLFDCFVVSHRSVLSLVHRSGPLISYDDALGPFATRREFHTVRKNWLPRCADGDGAGTACRILRRSPAFLRLRKWKTGIG